MAENRRNNSPPEACRLKELNPASSNSQKLEANTAGISKKNKWKVFIVANGAFEQTSSNTMFKTLLHDFYDSSQQHATKHTWVVINFLQPYINITGIFVLCNISCSQGYNKCQLQPCCHCLLSHCLKSLPLFLLSYQCNHFQLQQTL